MRFEIVGSGSMGLLYGAKLANKSYQVHCWCRSKEQAFHLNEDGITLQELNETHSRKVNVTAASFAEIEEKDMLQGSSSQLHDVQTYELSGELEPVFIILAVKQAQLDKILLQRLAVLCNRFTRVCIVALQNGVGHIEQIRAAVPHIPLITMISSEGAKRIGLTEVKHTGHGLTSIGDEKNNAEHVQLQKMLHKAFEKAGFSIAMSKNIKEQIYQKLLTNVIINPLTAIFHVSNGQLPEDPIRLQLMKKLFEETCSILVLENDSQSQYQFDHIIQVCHNTAANYSSMLQDILNHRTTEIQAINGAIVSLAHKYGRRAPINESLVQLIEALQP